MRYNWFQNRFDFQGMESSGLKLDLNSLKLLLLDKQQRFSLTIKGKKYNINYLAKCKVVESKDIAHFAISKNNDKIFIIRINRDYKYSPDIIYAKRDFLALCTEINRKLKV